MDKKDYKKIIKFEYIESVSSNSSCGTGYGQPDAFMVYCAEGLPAKVYIDTWYTPDESIKDSVANGLREFFGEPDNYNFDEAVELYKVEMNRIKHI